MKILMPETEGSQLFSDLLKIRSDCFCYKVLLTIDTASPATCKRDKNREYFHSLLNVLFVSLDDSFYIPSLLQAALAAFCSADFFVIPEPVPRVSLLRDTITVKVF